MLFLSRVDPMKGLELLLTAWAGIQSQFPQARLLIAGSGSPRYIEELKSLSVRLGVSRSITFLGFLFESAKWSAFAAADLFVLPSHYESFGIAALEALHVGTPLIISDRIPMSGMVAASGAGLVVRTDPLELEAALRTVLASSTLRDQMREHALRLSFSFATVDAVARKMKDVYMETLSRRSVHGIVSERTRTA